MQFKKIWKHHTKSKLLRYLSSNTWIHNYSERQRERHRHRGQDRTERYHFCWLLVFKKNFTRKIRWKKIQVFGNHVSLKTGKNQSWNNENLILEEGGQHNYSVHRSSAAFPDSTPAHPLFQAPSFQGKESLTHGILGS